MKERIVGTPEAWEERRLGCDERFVQVSDLDVSEVQDALNLKAISIRMPVSLLDDLKTIAKIHGLGYQPLLKQVLQRFVEAEKRKALNEIASQRSEEEHKEVASA